MDDHRPDPPTSAAHAARYDDAVWGHTRSGSLSAMPGVLAAFLDRPTDTASKEYLRHLQIRKHEDGASVPTINGAVSALRFLYTVTLRPRYLARSLVARKRPYKVPEVLIVEKPARLLEAAPGASTRRSSAWPMAPDLARD
jgi:site-specific recombinase XerD